MDGTWPTCGVPCTIGACAGDGICPCIASIPGNSTSGSTALISSVSRSGIGELMYVASPSAQSCQMGASVSCHPIPVPCMFGYDGLLNRGGVWGAGLSVAGG